MTDRRAQLLQATIAVIARRGVRGMRVQEVAADAGVSVTLLYHYFGSREGLLEAALEAVSEQAGRYAAKAAEGATSARSELVARLVGELAGTDEVQTNSAAWGELRWASVFDERLRPAVHKLTAEWVEEIAELVERVQTEEAPTNRGGTDSGGGEVAGGVGDGEGSRDGGVDAGAVAERLVALVEGLSGRWLTGAVPPAHLQDLLADAIRIELPPA